MNTEIFVVVLVVVVVVVVLFTCIFSYSIPKSFPGRSEISPSVLYSLLDVSFDDLFEESEGTPMSTSMKPRLGVCGKDFRFVPYYNIEGKKDTQIEYKKI